MSVVCHHVVTNGISLVLIGFTSIENLEGETKMKLGYWYKLKGLMCFESPEKIKQVYEVIKNFQEFCKKYELYENLINFQWYIEYQLLGYRSLEDEKEKETKK